jgi:hypothetical protein
VVSVEQIVEIAAEAMAATARTGDLCLASGAYRCDSCGRETIPVARGEAFPACAGERKPVSWVLIRVA